MAISHGIRKQSAATGYGVARYLAIGRLASHISGIVRIKMEKPIKQSVAVLIRNGDRILTTRRPDDDDELPGVWGLPAGTFQPAESLENLIARIGTRKLGVVLTPIRKLTEGSQDRPAYRLQMELWEVSMEGTPSHPAFQWAPVEILLPGRDCGSLCCELAFGVEKAGRKGKSRISL